jgi:hydroxymethylpyrimidine pyrophosphatase-like HAD family hydrolase
VPTTSNAEWLAERSAVPDPALVALDIDGTLLRTGEPVPEGTVQVVKQVRAAGHHVVLASGRSLVGILPVARQLGISNGRVVASNGAVTARLTPKAPLGFVLERVLRFDVGSVVDLALTALPGVRVGVEETGVGYWVNHLFAPGQVNGTQRVVDRDALGLVPSARVILQGNGVLSLVDRLAALRVTVNAVGTEWLDVTPANLSKATALEKIREDLGVAPENTIAVGDGMNDAEALTWAAHAVAMGHAPDALKRVADEVTGTIDEDGVIDVLRSLLGRTPTHGCAVRGVEVASLT